MTKQYDNFADLITFTRASTGTYLDSDGLLKTATTNTPRIEYDINGNRKGLLIEEARTNLITYSVVDDTTFWDLISAGVASTPSRTINYAVAPDGTTTAARIQCDLNGGTTSSDRAFLSHNTFSGTSGVEYTASVWVKSASGASYNVSMSISGATATTKSVTVTGEWQRIDTKVTYSTFSMAIRLGLDGAGGTSDTADFLVWGAQLEAGSFPTSYIPTAGSTATRAADVASIPTSAFGYNADKGTVVCDVYSSSGTSDARLFVISDSTNNNSIRLDINDEANFRFVVRKDGSTDVYAETTWAEYTSPFKAAASFSKDDFVGVLDGSLELTVSSGNLPDVNIFRVGSDTSGGSNYLNGHIKSIQYYPRRLTNAQIVRLTS